MPKVLPQKKKTGCNLCYPHTKAKRTAKADAERQGGKSLDVFNEAQKDNAALEALLEKEHICVAILPRVQSSHP